MKKILLYALLISASIHAMDSDESKNDKVMLAPYDLERHGQAVQQLFKKIFGVDNADDALINPSEHPKANVVVLEYKRKPAGFAIMESETVHHKDAFSDIEEYKNSSAALRVLRLNYLGVAHKYRKTRKHNGRGFGKKLLDHIKHVAQRNDQDIIALTSARTALGFYEKHGYSKTLIDAVRMALPMNEDIQDLLHQVRDTRIKNRRSGAYASRTNLLI